MKSKTAMIVLLILLLTGINVITAQENPITIKNRGYIVRSRDITSLELSRV